MYSLLNISNLLPIWFFSWHSNVIFGMQCREKISVIEKELINSMNLFFKDRIKSFVVSDSTDIPHLMSSIEATLYDFIRLDIKFDRGRLFMGYFVGKVSKLSSYVDLDRNNDTYNMSALGEQFLMLDKDVRLCIPDKYLYEHGWSEPI